MGSPKEAIMRIARAGAAAAVIGIAASRPAAAVEPRCTDVPDITLVGSCELRPGDRKYVPNGTLVIGDVSANGFRLYDDMAETGLMVVVTNPAGAEIQPPYGANVLYMGQEREVRSEIIGNKVQEMMETGCMPGGCSWVKISRDP